MSTHAKLAPSAAHRWLGCTASPGYLAANADKLPPNTSEYADEGTRAHEAAAYALLEGDVVCDDALMASYVKGYVEFVQSQVAGPDQLLVEQKVPLFYSPKEYGTVDAVVLTDEALFINDLKYGAGVSVEAKENPQLLIYAESYVRHRKLRETLPAEFSVVLTIYQPRAREGEPVRQWFTTLGELDMLATRIGATAKAIQANNEGVLRFEPSDKACRFCPAKGFCEARAKAMTDGVSPDILAEECSAAVIEHLASNPPRVLSNTELTRIAKAALKGDVQKWLKDVVDYVEQQLHAGSTDFPDFKLVRTEKRRTWVNEDEVVTLLRPKLGTADLWEKKLVSPAQAEKKLKGMELSTKFKNRFAELQTKPEGEPALALSDDPRPKFEKPQANQLEETAEELL